MVEELNNMHFDMVADFKQKSANKTADSYMLTIARDGESPARSIYFYDNVIDAAAGYAAYTDWGFAKEYLTVALYEPNGKVHEKILKRPRGGECVFVRNDYNEASSLLLSIKSDILEESYNKLVFGFARLFSKDNQRFNEQRFFLDTKYTGDVVND